MARFVNSGIRSASLLLMNSASKPRIVIFGASKGGERFLRRCGDQYDAVAFCDNDAAKAGTQIEGIEVVRPVDLSRIDFDRIIIASMYGNEIRNQLIGAERIDPKRIEFAPKSALTAHKSFRPFSDPATHAFALDVLEWIEHHLGETGIPFLLDHGTLLGAYRDGGIMPWDDDLDLSVEQADHARLIDWVRQQETRLPRAGELDWSAKLAIDDQSGEPLGLVLCFTDDNPLQFKPFGTAFWFMFRENGHVRQCINLAPARFFAGHDELVLNGRTYRTPRDVDAYLTHHYGDWRTPVQDMSHEEIRNYQPPPPMRWELLFGDPAVI